MTHHEIACEFYRSADEDAHPGWRVVKLFYAALHAANHARFAGKLNPNEQEKHSAIPAWLSDAGMTTEEAEYRALLHMSWRARYQPWNKPFTAKSIQPARAATERLFRKFNVAIPK